MATKHTLSFLTPDQIEIIKTEFGSLDQLYSKGLELVSTEFSIQRGNSATKQTDLASSRKSIHDLEDKLDALDLDGHRIITEITSDFGDMVVAPIVADLEARLKPLGLTFDETRKLIYRQ